MPQPAAQPRHLEPVPHAGAEPSVRLVKASPPPARTRASKVLPAIEQLLPQVRQQPGEWFRIATWPGKSSAASFRKRFAEIHPDLEVIARALPDGSGSGLWVMASTEP